MTERYTYLRYKDIREEARSSHGRNRNLDDYQDLFGFNRKELSGKSILDLGAGDSTFAEESVGLAGRVLRFDPKYSDDPPKYRNDAITDVVQNLPFQDNSFDEVFASVSLFWIKTGLDDALFEMIRVAKLEGQIRIFPAELKKGEMAQYSLSTHLAYVSKNRALSPTLFITKNSSYKPEDWRNEVLNILACVNF